MAHMVGPGISVGQSGEVHATQLNGLLQKRFDKDGNEYVYLKGLDSTVAGSWVVYDEVAVTALLATGLKGPVAVATAATVTGTFGWYQCGGTVPVAKLAANTADNAILGFETTAATAGDGAAAGDIIKGATSRGATAGAAANGVVYLDHPYI
jgi:hypothetical protein